MKFIIEQVALFPSNDEVAIEFLAAIGLDEWVRDRVTAEGIVFGDAAANVGNLAFNYQASDRIECNPKPLELEVLSYSEGRHWMTREPAEFFVDPMPRVSHFGMHVTESELSQWREKMTRLGVGVAQEVFTTSHENPAIAGKRLYHYTIFNTYPIIGVDLKFIVRRDDLASTLELP